MDLAFLYVQLYYNFRMEGNNKVAAKENDLPFNKVEGEYRNLMNILYIRIIYNKCPPPRFFPSSLDILFDTKDYLAHRVTSIQVTCFKNQ